MNENCPFCRGIGWVCERHPRKAFAYELGCACSDGMPCKCNDSTPPDTSEVIVIGEVTVP